MTELPRHPLLTAAGSLGVPRMIITSLVLALVLGAALLGLDLGLLSSQALWRVGMNLVLALSLLPMIRGGTGLNFGLPIGVVAGLLGVVVVLEADMTGFPAFLAAAALGVLIAIPIGTLYGLTLNAVRGNDMMVGMYLAFSFVSLFCVFWTVAPFDNPKLVWAIGGKGLRTTLQLRDSFGEVLDGMFAGPEAAIFGEFRIRLGLFLAAGSLFAAVWYFFRTRIGVVVRAAGENPRFAEASGIRVSRARVLAVVASTVLAAIGTVIAAQSYGFAQLYFAPIMLALPAIAAVLIGGATVHRASLANVLIGVLLFQTILTYAPPVLTAAVQGGDITEALRLTIQNGMILYALTRARGRT